MFFIDAPYIEMLLEETKHSTKEQIAEVLARAKERKGLSHRDIAILLTTEDESQLAEIYTLADTIKRAVYGKRIVIFAPLYVSNYCINNCTYCGYSRANKIHRKKLTMEEIADEARMLIEMGHKRIAMEAGEDPKNCDIDYITDAVKAVYGVEHKGISIRRINVNIAATTVENYKKLKQADIGTYILFQETYHRETFEAVHPKSVKGDYEYHTTAFDRAMEAGLDDVGGGVLFGLYDPRFEVLALMLHNEHLEEKFGVGFHTISVPRLKPAEGMNVDDFTYMPDDATFKKMVAIIRIAVPYTGIILSTRESAEIRRELLQYGVSQISAGSNTGVGGYKAQDQADPDLMQFEVSDNRSPNEILQELVESGYIPSYCTACYRKGRTGDRFMSLAKAGTIQYVCEPNALITFMEYIHDFADEPLKQAGEKMIEARVEQIEREDIKKFTKESLVKIKAGEKDCYL